MGHLRTGSLPKTKNWLKVISSVGDLAIGLAKKDHVIDIASKTLDASILTLRQLPYDQSVQSCFQFLIALSVAGQSGNIKAAAQENGIDIGEEPTKLQLSKALRAWLNTQNLKEYNPEFESLARKATVDTISAWVNENLSQTPASLFPQLDDPFRPWQKASDGRGFCELSRLFFSNFTSRYIKYFLSRTASSQFKTISDREKFELSISANIDTISQHAFETAKVVQSFSAGWFNKHAIGTIPTQSEVEGFLRHSFEKIREILRLKKEEM